MTLSVDGLTVSYGAETVLQGVSFAVRRGELLSVMGPNGAGKTTLFRCLLGIVRHFAGRIAMEGRSITSFSATELARRLAYIPQIHRPTFGYTVLDTALMGTTRYLSPFRSPGKVQVETALCALERVGAAHLAHRGFAYLSGGEQQLVLIARAIAQGSEILVMDEPTSALDYGNQLRIMELIRDLTREGYTVLASTHDPQHALTYAHRILALQGGTVVALGDARAVMTATLVRQLYQVDAVLTDTPAGRVIVPLQREGGS